MRRGSRILIDTNAIIEAHRVGCWRALCGYFTMESVEECVAECGTGDQMREDRVQVDVELLRKQMAVHPVSVELVIEFMKKVPDDFYDLDKGEKELLAYAFSRSEEVYILCSPDKASMRIGKLVGLLDSFKSLEEIAIKAGRANLRLPDPFNEHWHLRYRSNLLLEDI